MDTVECVHCAFCDISIKGLRGYRVSLFFLCHSSLSLNHDDGGFYTVFQKNSASSVTNRCRTEMQPPMLDLTLDEGTHYYYNPTASGRRPVHNASETSSPRFEYYSSRWTSLCYTTTTGSYGLNTTQRRLVFCTVPDCSADFPTSVYFRVYLCTKYRLESISFPFPHSAFIRSF